MSRSNSDQGKRKDRSLQLTASSERPSWDGWQHWTESYQPLYRWASKIL